MGSKRKRYEELITRTDSVPYLTEPLEADFEKQVVKWVEDRGGICKKVKVEGERGWPDRSIYLPGGFHIMVELKRPNGKGNLSPHQIETLSRLFVLGQRAFTCKNLVEFKLRMAEAGWVDVVS